MAVEEKKVLDALNLKFKGKSITKDFKNALAKKWGPKIETDEDIEDYINDREDVILEASAEGDRRATTASTQTKKDVVTKVTGEPNNEDDEPKDDLGKLLKAVGTLTEKITALENEKQASSIADRFKNDERLKGIPEKLLKGRYPTKDEDFEAAIEEAVGDLKDFVQADGTQQQQQQRGGFGKDKPQFGDRQVEQNQQTAQTKQALSDVKKFTATLPGNKASDK